MHDSPVRDARNGSKSISSALARRMAVSKVKFLYSSEKVGDLGPGYSHELGKFALRHVKLLESSANALGEVNHGSFQLVFHSVAGRVTTSIEIRILDYFHRHTSA